MRGYRDGERNRRQLGEAGWDHPRCTPPLLSFACCRSFLRPTSRGTNCAGVTLQLRFAEKEIVGWIMEMGRVIRVARFGPH